MRTLELCSKEAIEELEEEIKLLKEEIVKNKTLCNELEKACKETALYCKRENLELRKERVLKKWLNFLRIVNRVNHLFRRVNIAFSKDALNLLQACCAKSMKRKH